MAPLAALTLIAAACGDDDTADLEAVATDATDATEAVDDAAGAVDEVVEDTEEATAVDPESPDEATGESEAPKLAIVYSAEWFDGSWGEAAYEGAQALEEQGVVSEVALEENVPPGAEAERALRAWAEQGYNPIIAHSFNFGDDVKKVAEDFPDTIFVYAGGFDDVEGNVGDYEQPFYEASYLQGILAAGAVGEGDVAGAAGFEIPACYAMYEAYLAGVREVLPDAGGSFVAVGDWYDVQLAKEAALGQADGGATMFIGCGQGPTFGQIEAANDVGGVSSGYVGDMSGVGDSVLSSFEWRLDRLFEQIVADVEEGATEAKYYGVSLGDGGMDIVIDPDDADDISPEAMELYETRLAEIQDGSFTVPFVAEAP